MFPFFTETEQMSMRLLNGYPVCKVSWTKNEPIGDFLKVDYWHIIDTFFTVYRGWMGRVDSEKKKVLGAIWGKVLYFRK